MNPTFKTRGLNVTVTSFDSEAEFKAALAAPLSWGVDTLIFDLLLQQDGIYSSSVEFQSSTSVGSTKRLNSMIKVARDMGFEVWIKPIVFTEVDESRFNQATSYNWYSIKPDDAKAWFETYGARIKSFLSELKSVNVEAILLGNELGTLSTGAVYQGYWSSLINDLRYQFDLKIGYNASGLSRGIADTDEYYSVTFIDELDFFGISTYPRLYTSINPTALEIENGWFSSANGSRNIIQEIRNFIQAHPKTDLYFTEFGSNPTDGGNDARANIGWDVDSPRSRQRDLVEQALFFDVSFSVLSRELGDQIKGVFPFRWEPNTWQGISDTPPNQGIYEWNLQGKPAAEVIARWYSGEAKSEGASILGRVGPDLIEGGFYSDTIYGGSGSDTLIGGQGNDSLSGRGAVSSGSLKIKITGDGALLDGIAPTVNVFINSELVGIIDVDEIETYKKVEPSSTQSWNGPKVYSFDLKNDGPISDLRLTQINHKYSGPDHRNFWVSRISVDDIPLSPSGKLIGSDGTTIDTNTQAIYLTGSLVVDATPYNSRIQNSRSDDDWLLGGSGIDSAMFQGSLADYVIQSVKNLVEPKNGLPIQDGFQIVDQQPNRDGRDFLSGIERVLFADSAIALDTSGPAGQAYRIYEAAFNRTPDKSGLGYWITQMDKGMNTVDVAARFIDSPEFRSLYGQNPTNAEFLTKVYRNVLARTPDAAGLDWWVNEMKTNPSKTWQKVLADFSESTENQTNVASLIANGIEYLPWVG